MRRFRAHLLQVTPYRSARDEYTGKAATFLDANENPFAPTWQEYYYRYPDPYHQALRSALSAYLGVPAEEILCGAGSDEIIDWVIRSVCEPYREALLTLTPTYGVYETYAHIHAVRVKAVPLRRDFSLPVGDLLAAADEHTPLAVLCRPNNPTGTLWPAEEVEAFISAFPGWVVIDEAYIDFSSEPAGWLPRRREGTIILRTFSKAWGMAGWRVGYAIADPEVVSLFYRTKLPYNLSTPAQEEALRALQRAELVQQSLARLRAERARLTQALTALPIVQEVFPSEANFLLVRFREAQTVYQRLLERSIVTRYRGHLPLCEDTLRITIGLPEENEKLLQALCAISS
ncbi:MAG: histidinol-phosphate transaminase [Bacteroidia bacterium]|jgi:histidinol-phosphate aminotransferase|nr:histidinol-phosphate transaminase [Bacteroidia bacterium]GIV23630.1 MAG: histidinol-phosphate aminotransferase [Bacteroidia bacterium]